MGWFKGVFGDRQQSDKKRQCPSNDVPNLPVGKEHTTNIEKFTIGQSVYITVKGANCLYEPNVNAAIRFTPPMGDMVKIIRLANDWALIEYTGRSAWCPIEAISHSLIKVDDYKSVGCKPDFCLSAVNFSAPYIEPEPFIEYGPRGGRFVRTKKGFKRYL